MSTIPALKIVPASVEITSLLQPTIRTKLGQLGRHPDKFTGVEFRSVFYTTWFAVIFSERLIGFSRRVNVFCLRAVLLVHVRHVDYGDLIT